MTGTKEAPISADKYHAYFCVKHQKDQNKPAADTSRTEAELVVFDDKGILVDTFALNSGGYKKGDIPTLSEDLDGGVHTHEFAGVTVDVNGMWEIDQHPNPIANLTFDKDSFPPHYYSMFKNGKDIGAFQQSLKTPQYVKGRDGFALHPDGGPGGGDDGSEGCPVVTQKDAPRYLHTYNAIPTDQRYTRFYAIDRSMMDILRANSDKILSELSPQELAARKSGENRKPETKVGDLIVPKESLSKDFDGGFTVYSTGARDSGQPIGKISNQDAKYHKNLPAAGTRSGRLTKRGSPLTAANIEEEREGWEADKHEPTIFAYGGVQVSMASRIGDTDLKPGDVFIAEIYEKNTDMVLGKLASFINNDGDFAGKKSNKVDIPETLLEIASENKLASTFRDGKRSSGQIIGADEKIYTPKIRGTIIGKVDLNAPGYADYQMPADLNRTLIELSTGQLNLKQAAQKMPGIFRKDIVENHGDLTLFNEAMAQRYAAAVEEAKRGEKAYLAGTGVDLVDMYKLFGTRYPTREEVAGKLSQMAQEDVKIKGSHASLVQAVSSLNKDYNIEGSKVDATTLLALSDNIKADALIAVETNNGELRGANIAENSEVKSGERSLVSDPQTKEQAPTNEIAVKPENGLVSAANVAGGISEIKDKSKEVSAPQLDDLLLPPPPKFTEDGKLVRDEEKLMTKSVVTDNEFRLPPLPDESFIASVTSTKESSNAVASSTSRGYSAPQPQKEPYLVASEHNKEYFQYLFDTNSPSKEQVLGAIKEAADQGIEIKKGDSRRNPETKPYIALVQAVAEKELGFKINPEDFGHNTGDSTRKQVTEIGDFYGVSNPKGIINTQLLDQLYATVTHGEVNPESQKLYGSLSFARVEAQAKTRASELLAKVGIKGEEVSANIDYSKALDATTKAKFQEWSKYVVIPNGGAVDVNKDVYRWLEEAKYIDKKNWTDDEFRKVPKEITFAIKKLQKDNGLLDDGKIGENTWPVLQQEVAIARYEKALKKGEMSKNEDEKPYLDDGDVTTPVVKNTNAQEPEMAMVT